MRMTKDSLGDLKESEMNEVQWPKNGNLGIGTIVVEFADGTVSILHEVLHIPDWDLIYSSERGVEYDGISMTLCVDFKTRSEYLHNPLTSK